MPLTHWSLSSRSLFMQLLFSYKVNPQTAVLLGYSDTRLGTEIVDLTQQGRRFFIKVGYARGRDAEYGVAVQYRKRQQAEDTCRRPFASP